MYVDTCNKNKRRMKNGSILKQMSMVPENNMKTTDHPHQIYNRTVPTKQGLKQLDKIQRDQPEKCLLHSPQKPTPHFGR